MIGHVCLVCISLGYPQHVRDNLADLPMLQNLQMARLCDIAGTSGCSHMFIK